MTKLVVTHRSERATSQHAAATIRPRQAQPAAVRGIVCASVYSSTTMLADHRRDEQHDRRGQTPPVRVQIDHDGLVIVQQSPRVRHVDTVPRHRVNRLSRTRRGTVAADARTESIANPSIAEHLELADSVVTRSPTDGISSNAAMT